MFFRNRRAPENFLTDLRQLKTKLDMCPFAKWGKIWFKNNFSLNKTEIRTWHHSFGLGEDDQEQSLLDIMTWYNEDQLFV